MILYGVRIGRNEHVFCRQYNILFKCVQYSLVNILFSYMQYPLSIFILAYELSITVKVKFCKNLKKKYIPQVGAKIN